MILVVVTIEASVVKKVTVFKPLANKIVIITKLTVSLKANFFYWKTNNGYQISYYTLMLKSYSSIDLNQLKAFYP